MDYIYTRVSTDKQTTENQELALTMKYPNAAVISETASGAKNRPLLTALIDKLQQHDRLIIAALDRLGRKASEIIQLIESLTKKGVILISEREGVDYSTIAGRLVTQILVSVAEMERSLISERTKVGLKTARSKGKQIGASTNNQNRKGKYKVYDQVFIDRFTRLSKALSPKELSIEFDMSLTKTYELKRRFAA